MPDPQKIAAAKGPALKEDVATADCCEYTQYQQGRLKKDLQPQGSLEISPTNLDMGAGYP